MPDPVGERVFDGHRGLTIASAAAEREATFVPDAGMVCCSLRHRGEEILGRRNGLAGYVERKSTMGIPLLYPWANRLSRDRLTVGGREIDLRGEHEPLKRDANGLPIHGLLTAARGWEVERHERLGTGAVLAARFEWERSQERCRLFPSRTRCGSRRR
jgi:galactose mutarotase-like enzyme